MAAYTGQLSVVRHHPEQLLEMKTILDPPTSLITSLSAYAMTLIGELRYSGTPNAPCKEVALDILLGLVDEETSQPNQVKSVRVFIENKSNFDVNIHQPGFIKQIPDKYILTFNGGHEKMMASKGGPQLVGTIASLDTGDFDKVLLEVTLPVSVKTADLA